MSNTATKILVVDDEVDLEALMRQKFRRRIRASEFEFYFAHNGLEALEQLHAVPGIDIVLTDINMPEMDGLTLLEELRGYGSSLKAVVVSAYGDLANIRTAMNRGAFDFVTKPIDFEDLEVTIHKTMEQIALLREGAQARSDLLAIHDELELAGSLQRSILPNRFPHRSDHSLHATMVPAKEVGGDFYDFFYIDDHHLGMVMADVSGKGITAAMFMAVSRTLLRFSALQGLEVGPCLAHVNNLLCMDNAAGMFVTVFYGILDLRTGALTYANGGHNPPYRVSTGGEVSALPGTQGMALGALEGIEYKMNEINLLPGEMLLLFTDGVTEAMNESYALFGESRLEQLLARSAGADPNGLIKTVVEEVMDFAGTAPQADDVTLLALRYDGQSSTVGP